MKRKPADSATIQGSTMFTGEDIQKAANAAAIWLAVIAVSIIAVVACCSGGLGCYIGRSL